MSAFQFERKRRERIHRAAASRAAEILSERASTSFNLSQCLEEIAEATQRHLPTHISNSRHAVTRLDIKPKRFDSGWRIEGFYGEVRRLIAFVQVTPARIAIPHILVATHGTLNASEALLASGTEIEQNPDHGRGNRVLVARLLHLAVYALARSGVDAIRANPIPSPRVRARYEAMGFDPTTWTLSLRDEDSLILALESILTTYEENGISFEIPPPPL